MSVMYLLRHGQTMFHSKNKDHLSPAGELQSEMLGTYLKNLNLQFDAVYCGSLSRHQQTAARVKNIFQKDNLIFPKTAIDERLNELHDDEIFQSVAPKLAKHDVAIARWLEQARDNRKVRQKLLKSCFHLWQNIPTDLAEDFESWTQFCQRVDDVVAEIQVRHQSGSTVAVFTSAGVIARCVQLSLQLPDSATYSLLEPLTNVSVTACFYGPHDLRLHFYNDHSYLNMFGKQGCVTYR